MILADMLCTLGAVELQPEPRPISSDTLDVEDDLCDVTDLSVRGFPRMEMSVGQSCCLEKEERIQDIKESGLHTAKLFKCRPTVVAAKEGFIRVVPIMKVTF